MPESGTSQQRPTRKDVDIFGMCHLGLVRKVNQDHFLVASLHKSMQLHQTTLPNDGLGSLVSGARGYVFLVADGVGSTPWGEQASGSALRAIADYVIHGMDLDAVPDTDHEHRGGDLHQPHVVGVEAVVPDLAREVGILRVELLLDLLQDPLFVF